MTKPHVLASSLAASFAGALLLSTSAFAADPWVERRLTLPTHDWAFDGALGIGHSTVPIVTPFGSSNRGFTGPGLNLEGKVSVIHHLELGFRTGVRFGDEAINASADYYGRMYDRQSFALGNETMANPELRIRGELVDLEIVEFALEGRAIVPLGGSRFAIEMGIPLAFHLGSIVRLDTGVYIPVFFGDTRTTAAFSIPFDAWFQISRKAWLGPMTGAHFVTDGGPTDISLGFGFGYQVASFVDLKTMALAPTINRTPSFGNVGLGVGVQIRIE